MPVVGDLNQNYQARIKVLRDAQEIAQPAQPLDNTTLMGPRFDGKTVLDADATAKNDMNTSYGEITGYLTP
jgi:hypothetical protein